MAKLVRRGGLLAVLFSALILVSGCVVLDSPEKIAQVEETNDPFEPTNRYIFELNRFLDEFMLKPAAAWYNAALPQPAQDGVQRFMANLRLPWTAINDFFQGKPERSYTAVTRFVINSTVGILGVFDVATGWGFPQHDEDSGQTFAVMGAPEGPYLMLPIFGPSNPRDAFGLVVDYFVDPVNIIGRNNDIPVSTIRGGVTAVDNRNRNGAVIDDLQKRSTDFYATVRSIYRQRRDAQIQNRGEDSNYPGPRLSVEPAGAWTLNPPLPPRRDINSGQLVR
jgi:phospholipid-binding lipoprotein MlaA